jgi:hypothetical protein
VPVLLLTRPEECCLVVALEGEPAARASQGELIRRLGLRVAEQPGMAPKQPRTARNDTHRSVDPCHASGVVRISSRPGMIANGSSAFVRPGREVVPPGGSQVGSHKPRAACSPENAKLPRYTSCG